MQDTDNIDSSPSLSNLTGIVDFLKTILNDYKGTFNKEKNFNNQLTNIQNRIRDTNLNLAIIGEFSSGKSTLINSLLRDDILSSSLIPATTCAATLIEYGAKLELVIEFRNGNVLRYPSQRKSNFFEELNLNSEFVNKKDILELIGKITAQEEIASTIEKVKIYHPSSFLKSGIIIIDTPGTNVSNKRHAEVAKWAVEEHADAALVLVPAANPVNQSLADFLEQHLKDSLHRCIFGLTKIDLIRKKERESVKEVTTNRLKSFLKIDAPFLLPVSTVSFLDGEVDGNNELYHKLFLEFENKIINLLSHYKYFLIHDKLNHLISKIVRDTSFELQTKESQYENEHRQLEANRIPKLKKYVAKQKLEIVDGFVLKLKNIESLVSDRLDSLRISTLNTVADSIDSATSSEQLKSIADNQVRLELEKLNKAIEICLKPIHYRIISAFKTRKDKFLKEFRESYESLATLGGILNFKKEDITEYEKEETSFNLIETRMKNVFQRTEKQEEESKGKGALIGLGLAALTIGLGPFSLLAGFFAGSFFGGLFGGPTLPELKQKIYDEIKSSLAKSFEEIKSKSAISFNEEIKAHKKKLNRLINNHYDYYQELDIAMQERDNTKREELVKKKKKVEMDLEILSNMKNKLESKNLVLRKKISFSNII